MIDVHTVVKALIRLDLSTIKINEFYQSFDNIILTPRIALGPDRTTAAISVTGDDIQLTGRLPDPDIRTTFRDVYSIIDYLSTRLPPTVAVPLSEVLIPSLTSKLISTWLLPSVPSSLDGMQEFQEILALVLKLADMMDPVGWHGKAGLLDWVDQAPRVWLTKRREASLGQVRTLLSRGLGNVKQAERVETETLLQEDDVPKGSEANNDWSADWSDDEDRKHGPVHTTTKKEDIDASAWGLDDDVEDTEMAAKDKNAPQSNIEKEADDAWGWGDENDQEASVQTDQKQTERGPTSNGHAPKSVKSSKREVTLKEVYSITALPEAMLELIIQVVSEAETLAQPKYVNS